MLGVLLIDKPKGITSHDVVNRLRHALGTRRVGHAGTLDPLATGLLVVAVGPATRFLQYLPLEPKHYLGEVVFGETTATYDAEGEVTERKVVPENLAELVESVRSEFLGLISQVPPMHSAVKVRGKALYRYAREGQELEREPRNVHLDRLDVEWLSPERARIEVVCSGGTYIRSLAHDLGQRVGCGGHLAGLIRVGVGKFRLEDAMPLDAAAPDRVLPLREALPPMALHALDASETAEVRMGRTVPGPDLPEGRKVGLVGPDGNVFGVARVQLGMLQPECVIPAEVADGAV